MENKQLAHSDFEAVNKKLPFCFLANDILVPMNVGSLFRIADALGISKIYLCGSTPTPPNSKINKTARSTVKVVDYEYKQSAVETVNILKEEGYIIVSLELTNNSIDLADYQILNDQKICLIIGAESEGVHADLLKLSDQVVHIPMLGLNSSMNVATATAIAAYEIAKQF